MRTDEKVAKKLLSKSLTIAVAESCTGGLLTHRLTNISGSSSFLWLGIVAYDNQAKIKLLKVPPSIIKQHGAVSLPVAKLMAKNVRRILNTDLGVGITGIAGPTGGTKSKPIGLVFVAVANKGTVVGQKFLFKGSRLSIKTHAADKALSMLSNLL